MKNYLWYHLSRNWFYKALFIIVVLLFNKELLAAPEDIIFYNGTNQTFEISLVNLGNGNLQTVLISPGSNNLGSFEEISYKLTMPYMLEVVNGTIDFYWGCDLMPSIEWYVFGSKMVLDDYWLSGDCINLISLNALPNQYDPPPLEPFDFIVNNATGKPFDITFESLGFVDGEAYKDLTIDTGINNLGLFKKESLRILMPIMDDVISGSTRILWDCNYVNLDELIVNDWGMSIQKNLEGESCNYTIAFLPDTGEILDLIFQNNTQNSFSIKMVRRTGQQYLFNILPGFNDLGLIRSGEHELYVSNLPEITSGLYKLTWEGNEVEGNDWLIDSFGLKLNWKGLMSMNVPHFVLNSDINYYPEFKKEDYNNNFILTTVYKEPFTSLPLNPSPHQVTRQLTFYDGLGRAEQYTQELGSPYYNDIIVPISYDELGRESINYLPFSYTTGYKMDAVNRQALFYVNPPHGITKTAAPFAEKKFESSPLNRITEEGSEGELWQISQGHTKKTSYLINTAEEVRLYHAETLALSDKKYMRNLILLNTGHYLAGQLFKTVFKDENWTLSDGKAGTVEEFKNKEGDIVLKRIFNRTTSDNTNELQELSTYYVYDDFGNLSFVLPPGIEPDRAALPTAAELDNFAYRYRYDGRKRMVEKKLPGKGTEYIVYNTLDQPILTQDSLQRTTNSWLFSKYDAFGRPVMSGKATLPGSRVQIQAVADTLSVLWETADNSNVVTGYQNTTRTYPAAINIDHYLTVSYYDGYGFPGAAAVAPQNLPSDMTKGLPTGSRVYTADGSDSYLSASYYDDKGRVTEMVSQNHVSGTDRIVNTYNFPGELKTSTRTHTGHNKTTVIGTSYSYDHMGRRLRTEQYIDDPNQKIVLSELAYNEIGQLKEKKIHSEDDGATFLNTESYAYNARGWLKSQSGPKFSLQLKYEDGTSPQYNGNISNQYWGTAANPTLHNYSYLYDRLNRLTSGVSDEGFNETINYDKMGNITGLTRNPMGSSSYAYSGNRLTGISGALNSSYGYDANGNQTSDSGKGITIAYNYLNLPKTISKAPTSETMTNSWLATGAKISKTVGGTTRDYAGGIEYSDGTIDFIQTEEGRAIPLGGSGYSYEYMLKDHLGNTRVLLKEDGSVLETSDYYPFGLQVSRSGQTVPSPENRYKYNGKELQTEMGLGQYDYGARFYDPVIGRWNVVDPLAEGRPEMTPYHFVSNNPINRIDPDGRWDDWVQNADGEIHWDKNATSQATTKAGETYLGRDLTFTFNSYIDGDLWDGPMGSFPAGDKLTSTINVTSNTDADNNLLSVDIKSSTFVHKTGGIFQGDGYYPGQKNVNLDIKGATSGYASFEKHAKVNGFEEMGLGMMGYDKVNVAQKLTLGLSGNNLSVIGSTDIFPSATLSVNGNQLFKYNQPSFKGTHGYKRETVFGDNGMGGSTTTQSTPLRPAPAFYQRYKK